MSATFAPGTVAKCATEVELTISCRGLLGKDTLSKSDPMCVTFIQPFGEKEWVEYHRTEQIDNNHNPDFQRKVSMPFKFEEQQPLKFEIYDVDTNSSSLSHQDFLGVATCTLGQIISSGKVELPLLKKGHTVATAGQRGQGHMIIVAEEQLSALKDEVVLQFSGKSLDKKDTFSKSDPYLEFFKLMETGDYSIVHKTEVIKNTLNPTWQEFTIPVRTFCNGDYGRRIKIVCYDWNSNGKSSVIGECYATLKQLSAGPSEQNCYKLINPKKQEKKGYTNSGQLTMMLFKLQKSNTVVGSVEGGTPLPYSITGDIDGDARCPDVLPQGGAKSSGAC